MFTERNTGNNLPAQIEIYASPGDEYELVFMAKGGGSANKSFLFQETKALLNPESLIGFLDDHPAHCSAHRPARRTTWRWSSAAPRPNSPSRPPSYASAKYLDTLPTAGSARPATAFGTSNGKDESWS